MTDIYENKIIEMDKIDNSETKENKHNELCLICMDMKGDIILCSKCKYVYCPTCAEKINKLCSICFRNKNITNSNLSHNYYDYYSYYDEYDELNFEPSTPHYFSVMASFAFSIIIGFCWIGLFFIFGYIGIIFLLRIIFNLMNFL